MKRKPSDNLLEVAQEITFAKALASNDKTIRDRSLRRLRKWLTLKAEASKKFTEDGIVRLWKGLFFNVWMSDKPLVQEEVAEGISNLVHCFTEFEDVLSFILGFFQTLSDYWFGLDVHRMDKYLMFVRRFIRQSFKVLEKYGWRKKNILALTTTFKKGISKAPLGLLMHICEIYLEELAKVSKGVLSKDLVPEFIKPFGEKMSVSSDPRLVKHVGDFIYMYLLKQSDLGIKHEIKFQEWRKLGCPEGNINVMREVEIQSEEEFDDSEGNSSSLDARAGHVDVILPTLMFDTSMIIKHLTELKNRIHTTTRARKRLIDIINKYKTFEHGKYPLGIHKVDIPQSEDEEEIIDNAAFELLEEELEVYNKDKLPVKRKNIKKPDFSTRGKWIVSPSEVNIVSKIQDASLINKDSHNKWKVSTISSASGETGSTKLFEERMSPNENVINGIQKNKTKMIETPKYSECFAKVGNMKKKLKNGSTIDWGNAAWDDEHETEIIIEPKKKVRHSDILPITKCNTSLIGLDRKNSSFTIPSRKKRVEFVLNKNSFQDLKEYKRSLKEKPFLKFDGVNPPLGVLKSTPLNSLVNPFILPVNEKSE